MDRPASDQPIALGFLALAAATILVSVVELRWAQGPGREVAAVVLVAFTAPLQLLVCLTAVARDDEIVATGMGVLAGTWATVGVVLLSAPPAGGMSVLGLFLLVAGIAMALPGAAAALDRRLPAVVLLAASARLVVAGLYQLIGSNGLRVAAGLTGLALGAVAFAVAGLMLVDRA